mgnify:FL=1
MDKIEWLQRHGYLRSLDGGPCASLKGLALLGSVDIQRLRDVYTDGQLELDGVLLRDMRRGANGNVAMCGTNDMVELLWRLARRKEACRC